MADKAISELVAAPSVTPDSLFVLQQDGTAKKLTAQVLENWLLSFADGHGGIQSYELLKTEGLVKTYRFTLADQTPIDIDVVDGRGIESVKPTSTNGLVDTYTITYNDGKTDTITVTNGAKGDKGDRADIWVKYASQKPTASSHSFGDVPDSWIGIATGHNMDAAPTDWQVYTWFQWKGEKGDTGDPATLVSSQVTYHVGDSGTIIPSGSWTTSVPPVTPGKFLWTRQVLQFNTGAPITSYSVSRFGIDGAGAVSTVAGVAPDPNGNVPLDASSVKALAIKGGTMEGPINMNGQNLSGLNAPTADNEAVNKEYVDTNKVDKSKVANKVDVTEEGFVADARALKVLNDSKLSLELLWENASPQSAFAPRKITMDFSGYSQIELEFIRYRGQNGRIFRKARIDQTGYSEIVEPYQNTAYIFSRNFKFTQTSVEFDGGYTCTASSAVQDNERMIPFRIYGIKGVS